MKNYKALAGAAALALGVYGMAGGAAQAVPYTSGSFAFGGATVAATDVTTTTNFPLNPASITISGIGSGSFTSVALPGSLALTGAADFNTPGTFDFADAALGTFTASSASLLSTVSGNNASATWDVEGTFTVGSAWDNVGTIFSANETWTFSQTGGAGGVISVAGTFNSPAVAPPPQGVPEPATLALLGAGLMGMGAMRFRRKKKA